MKRWLFTSLGGLLLVVPLTAQQSIELPARDRTFESELETLYTVGSIDGDEWELFGEIEPTTRGSASVAFDGAGNLYVFDDQNGRVVVVSPEGEFLREIGEPGEGPGELRSPTAFTVMRDGTVAVADMGHRSWVVYSNEGEYLRSVPLGEGGVIIVGALFPGLDGESVLSAGRRSISISRTSGGAPSIPSGRPIVRHSLAEEGGTETVFDAWEPPAPEPEQRTVSSGGGMRMAFVGNRSRAFEPNLLAGVLGDGRLVVSDSSAYAIKVLTAEGRIARVLERPIEPRRMTDRIQEAERERRLAALEGGDGPRFRVETSTGGGQTFSLPQEQVQDMVRQQIESLEFYPEVPVLTDLAAGWGDKIWVQRRGRDPMDEDGPVDVVSASGEYLGTLEPGTGLPDAFGPDGLVAFVERDEFDVASVTVKRLPASLR